MNPRLVTCRYWALGPNCPNVDRNGIEACGYAHRDTGTLVSSFLQRGTCANWLNGQCYRGRACYYEHRDTGVYGLYQGILPLIGLNLEIADAAAKSGFDTFNHEGLMNMIWAVKRIVLRNNIPTQRIHRSKDPIYPDRYRPSGIGDNTSRKRPLPATNVSPPTHATDHVVPGEKRKKRNKKKGRKVTERLAVNTDTLDRVLGVARIIKPTANAKFRLPIHNGRGTQNNPINLLSDTEGTDGPDTLMNQRAKRQKLTTTMANRHRINDLSANDPTQAFSLLDAIPSDRPNTTLEITKTLAYVKKTLELTQKAMVEAKTTMKDLFGRNDTRLGDDGIFPIMTRLSTGIYRSHDAAGDAIYEVGQSIDWLERNDLKKTLDEIS